MTPFGQSEPHAAGGGGRIPFSPADWGVLQAADRQAARHIVGLMLSIFVLGLLMYLTIDLIVG